jgi:hypothetical protein
MIRNLMLLIALAVGAIFAAGENSMNWNGYLDTIRLPSFSSTNTVYSGKTMSMTDYDMVRLILHVNDTSSAGFASDSVNMIWGYQSWSPCLNSSGVADTCFSPRVVVDTCRTALFGTMSIQVLDANGIAATPTKCVDTSACAGYAVQSRTFAPEWDVGYRIWATGITGNRVGAPLKIFFTDIRRLYRGSRSK